MPEQVQVLPALPLKNTLLFPNLLMPLAVGRPSSISAVQAALEHNWPWKRTALVLLASLLPAGPFVVDARLLRARPAPERV